MSNVVSMERSCDYLVRRAASKRLKGCFDGAMTLLSKAKDQFGLNEEIEIEMARVYDEIGCEEEAARSYLRVVRLGGSRQAEALFHLALSSAQAADLPHAFSYYEMFLSTDQKGVSAEYASLLGEQLRNEIEQPAPSSKRGRARQLVRRGVERMHAGKTAAAQRTLLKALNFHQNAQTHTLIACCALLRGDADLAIEHGEKAHKLAPGRVQSLLVLADAHALAGDEKKALRALYLAAMRAENADDYLATALESAKRGQDALTLRLTHRLLKMEPYHTRGMMLRACAFANMGRLKEASRLFGRVCVLMPENTVSEALYRMTREGEAPSERLSLGLEVPYPEGMSRAMQLVSCLYVPAQELREDRDRERALCRIAGWAFRSLLAGEQVSNLALLIMSGLDTEASRSVLCDALMDPQVDDMFKYRVLQVFSPVEGNRSFPVDMEGRFVRLAAGGTTQHACDDELCRGIVQQAADALLPGFSDAPQKLLDMWLAYLDAFGTPDRSAAAACAAALEYAYHCCSGRTVSMKTIADRYMVSPRFCRYYARRILSLTENREGTPENDGGI